VARVQLSIRKLAVILIVILILVTLVTTGIGLAALHRDFRTLSDQHEIEARDTLRNASLAIRDRVRFYQGILQLIASKPEVSNLLQFGQTHEMIAWAHNLRSLLPGSLGAAFVSPAGEIYGNPTPQRIGPACVHDMSRLHSGNPIDFPPLHTDIAGFEHFDLLTQVETPEGDSTGTVFVSFRLGIISEVLQSLGQTSDRFELRDSNDTLHLQSHGEQPSVGAMRFEMSIPDTSWKLVLYRTLPSQSASFARLLIADALILVLSGILIVSLVRSTLSGFTRDMQRIHSALADVLDGKYRPSAKPTAIKETLILLPDIEQLAVRLQDERKELRHQSLSDPLTGVFNRRYFDMMLAHQHEQSRRQPPAQLLIIDLNDFKRINDRFGHQTGDRVLQNTARYLLEHIRATDIVARLGGDEFALILFNMAEDALEPWVTTLLDGYDALNLDHQSKLTVHGRLSVGVAAIDADRYANASDVFVDADRMMYSVKQPRDLHRSRFAIAMAEGSRSPLIAAAEGQ
jgi:diguanylate cyclase (GGDEF)-like protein